jgi:superfamily II DNA/RNA helicase
MSSLESLRTFKRRSIVVASDVAARGLDIPSVSTVVHYDVARTIDTFIHRSGRTAVSTKWWCFLVSWFDIHDWNENGDGTLAIQTKRWQ